MTSTTATPDPQEVLDPGRRPAVDQLLRAASVALTMPVVVLTLLGRDGVRVGASRGIDLGPDAPSPFGGVSLSPGELVVIPDARLDPRTATESVVRDAPQLRSCVGAAVCGEGERVLGALWLGDFVTQPMLELDALPAIARALGEVIELREALGKAMATAGRAEAVLDQKDRLTSRLSHDLRTPMTAILGFGELLKLEELTTDGRESLDHVLSSGRKLLVMIDQVLDLNRLARGEGQVEIERVSVAEIVKVARVAQASFATDRSVKIVVDPSCSRQVLADKQLLQRTIINLVGTTLDRARAGTTMHVAAATTAAGDVQIVLGPEASRGVASGGLLEEEAMGDKRAGLTLARQLMEAMGGAVGLVSTSEATGSPTYWLRLPVAPDEPSPTLDAGQQPTGPAAGAAAPGVSGHAVDASGRPPTAHRLLYIEDDPANQRLLTRMFARDPDIDVVSALDGATGLEKAWSVRPDIVLLDLGLPDISGRDVLARLTGDERTSGVPIVVLSGEVESERPAELCEAGATAYLTKPFVVRELVYLVTSLLQRAGE